MPGPKDYYQELEEINNALRILSQDLADVPQAQEILKSIEPVSKTLKKIGDSIDEITADLCDSHLARINRLSEAVSAYLKDHKDSSEPTKAVKKLSVLMNMSAFKTAGKFIEQRKAYLDELKSGQRERDTEDAYRKLETEKTPSASELITAGADNPKHFIDCLLWINDNSLKDSIANGKDAVENSFYYNLLQDYYYTALSDTDPIASLVFAKEITTRENAARRRAYEKYLKILSTKEGPNKERDAAVELSMTDEYIAYRSIKVLEIDLRYRGSNIVRVINSLSEDDNEYADEKNLEIFGRSPDFIINGLFKDQMDKYQAAYDKDNPGIRAAEEKEKFNTALNSNGFVIDPKLKPVLDDLSLLMNDLERSSESFIAMRTALKNFVNQNHADTMKAEYRFALDDAIAAAQSYYKSHSGHKWTDNGARRRDISKRLTDNLSAYKKGLSMSNELKADILVKGAERVIPGITPGTFKGKEYDRNLNLPFEITVCGNTNDLADYLVKHENELGVKEKQALLERIANNAAIENRIKDIASGEKPLKINIKADPDSISFPDLHTERQSSANGCWSHSYSLLLKSRGIDIDPKAIREYRSGLKLSEIDPATDLFTKMVTDRPLSIEENADLIMDLIPNTGLYTRQFDRRHVGDDKVKSELTETLLEAFNENKSPVAVNTDGHYITITGIRLDEQGNFMLHIEDSLKNEVFGKDCSIDTLLQHCGNTVSFAYLKDLTPDNSFLHKEPGHDKEKLFKDPNYKNLSLSDKIKTRIEYDDKNRLVPSPDPMFEPEKGAGTSRMKSSFTQSDESGAYMHSLYVPEKLVPVKDLNVRKQFGLTTKIIKEELTRFAKEMDKAPVNKEDPESYKRLNQCLKETVYQLKNAKGKDLADRLSSSLKELNENISSYRKDLSEQKLTKISAAQIQRIKTMNRLEFMQKSCAEGNTDPKARLSEKLLQASLINKITSKPSDKLIQDLINPQKIYLGAKDMLRGKTDTANAINALSNADINRMMKTNGEKLLTAFCRKIGRKPDELMNQTEKPQPQKNGTEVINNTIVKGLS